MYLDQIAPSSSFPIFTSEGTYYFVVVQCSLFVIFKTKTMQSKIHIAFSLYGFTQSQNLEK